MQIIWIKLSPTPPPQPFIIACEKSDHKGTKTVLLLLTLEESGCVYHSAFTWVWNSEHTYASKRPRQIHTPTRMPRCSLAPAMVTAWKLTTQTEKDKERGTGISEMSGTPSCWHFPNNVSGAFSAALELDFPTGKLGIQSLLRTSAFLGSPRVWSGTQMGVGGVPWCCSFLLEGPGLVLGVEGGEVWCFQGFLGLSLTFFLFLKGRNQIPVISLLWNQLWTCITHRQSLNDLVLHEES